MENITCKLGENYSFSLLCPPPPQKAERGIWKCHPSGYIVNALGFLFVDQLISNLHTSIILRISSLSLKLGKIRKQILFFIEKVHILRITHFSETTKDRSLIFGMGGDANVKLRMQHSPLPQLSLTPLGNLYKKFDRNSHPKPYVYL